MSALGRANLSSGFWLLVEQLQQWEGVTLAPPKSTQASVCEVAKVSLQHAHFVLSPMQHFQHFTNSYKVSELRRSIFFHESYSLCPALCLSERDKTALHEQSEKDFYFCNFIFQSQAFSCIRLSVNLGSCNFDLFTLCLQHRLQLHFLLNVLYGIEEPLHKKKTSTGFLFLCSFLKRKKDL